MNNFNYQNPVQIIFGKEQIETLKDYLPKDKKILFLYGGGSIKKNGIYDKVIQALAGFDFCEFSGIEPNPRYETLMSAVDLAKKEGVEFLLPVGGGSVIDGTKFIAMASLYTKSDPWHVYQQKENFTEALPIGAVLTLPATGSEMNCVSVVSRGKEKLGLYHPALYPKFSILDPTVTFSLNEKQLGNGAVDAFVHVCEQYLTYDVNTPLQDRMSEAILSTLLEEGPKVIHVKDDYNSRANLMWSATMALNGLIGSGVVHDWSTHMIGHELTVRYDIDHARTLAVVQPSLLRFQKEQKKTKLDQMGRRVFNLAGDDLNQRVEQTITLIEDFYNSVGVPTKLRVYGVKENDLSDIAQSLGKQFRSGLGEHGNLKEQEILTILKEAY